jgi:hypothetical protein
MPEGLQTSEKGEQMENNISELEDVDSNIQTSLDSIDTILE